MIFYFVYVNSAFVDISKIESTNIQNDLSILIIRVIESP